MLYTNYWKYKKKKKKFRWSIVRSNRQGFVIVSIFLSLHLIFNTLRG